MDPKIVTSENSNYCRRKSSPRGLRLRNDLEVALVRDLDRGFVNFGSILRQKDRNKYEGEPSWKVKNPPETSRQYLVLPRIADDLAANEDLGALGDFLVDDVIDLGAEAPNLFDG